MEKELLKMEIDDLNEEKRDIKVNHILHLILSILSYGLWIIVWAFISLMASDARKDLSNKIHNKRLRLRQVTIESLQ